MRAALEGIGSVGVLCRADALAAGWTDIAIRHAVRSGRWVRLRRGVYAVYAAADGQADVRAARAAAVSCPRAAVSHHSAASMHGLPVVGLSPRHPCLTVPGGTALRHLIDAHLHRAALPLR